jgi:hypothetical protein
MGVSRFMILGDGRQALEPAALTPSQAQVEKMSIGARKARWVFAVP